ECGRGNTEDDVVGGLCERKAGLHEVAISSIGAAGDGEQVLHSTVRGVGVRIAEDVKEEREPNFTHRTIRLDERRNDVEAAIDRPVGNRLAWRIEGWTGSADGRLRMAGAAGVGVEPWPQAVIVSTGHDLVFGELREPGLEKRGLVR